MNSDDNLLGVGAGHPSEFATESGVNCHSCRSLQVLTPAFSQCANWWVRLAPPTFTLVMQGRRTKCGLWQFGVGSAVSPRLAPLLRRVFVEARAELLELLAEPSLSDERRAEVLEWLARPLPPRSEDAP